MSRLGGVWWRALFVFVFALLALAPGPVSAHATILSSSPAPGERLRTAPGVVVVTFSEALNVRLSRATVVTPSGDRFAQGSVTESEIRIPLTTDAPGVYDVRWTSVSAADGHALAGEYHFGVGVASAPAGSAESVPSAPEESLAVARAAEYAALLLAVGLFLLIQLARQRPQLPWLRTWLPGALAACVASGVAVVGGEWLTAAGVASPAALVAYLDGPTGWIRIARVAAEATALLLALRWPRAATLPLAAALVALAGAGHASAAGLGAAGVAVTTIHLAGAGLWAGGILGLALQSPPGGWLGGAGRLLLARFTPVAMGAFALTAATGLLQAANELSGLGDLVATAYGQTLGAKALTVLLMVPLSLLAWRRVGPRPRLDERFQIIHLEAGLALVVVAASALLAAIPLPPAQLHEAAAATAGPAAALARPAPGDLTLAAPAGDTLVGLTLRPGKPGRNAAWLWLLPLKGDQAASRLRVAVAEGAHGLPTQRCGPACRVADLTIHGGETLRIEVVGAGGGTATFAIPALPAEDARGLVDRAERRMHDLITYRVDETLKPAREPLAVTYAYEAPDRVEFQIAHGGETVIIGGDRYSRDAPSAAWQRAPVSPVDVPSFVWDDAEVIAPRALGTSVEDGLTLSGAAFFEDTGSVPIWFELWIDEAGLVRRAEMRAVGHFMQDRYRDFDATFTIQAPAA